MAPPVVPLSAPVDSRAVQAPCVESSEFVDLSREALRHQAFSVVLLAEALQFAVPGVRQLPLVQFAEAQVWLLQA